MDPAEEESPEARGGKIGYILLWLLGELAHGGPEQHA
jgi:hypothetical protein